jgi:hypothetical protein
MVFCFVLVNICYKQDQLKLLAHGPQNNICSCFSLTSSLTQGPVVLVSPQYPCLSRP